MKNPVLRWSLIVFAVLAGLMLLAAGVLYFLISRIDTRAEIERALERATGRDVAITGEVGVSFYPLLGLRAENVALANAPGGRAAALASVDAVSLGVEIRPLLSREIVVRDLILVRPQIALEVDTQGRPNWALTPEGPAQTNAPTPDAPAAPPDQQPQALKLEDIALRDGEISYFDARRNTGWRVSSVNVRTAVRSLGEPVIVDGDLLYGGQKIELQLVANLPRAVLAGRPTTLAARISSELLTGSFDGEIATATGVFSGQVSAQGPSLRRALAWLLAPIDAGYGLEAFSVNGLLRTAPRAITFENASFSIDEVRGRGDFTLTALRGHPYVSGRLEVFDLDLNPYLAAATRAAEDNDGIAGAASAPSRAVDVGVAPSEAPFDFAGLKALNADIELTTGPLKFQRMRAERAQLALVLNDGFLAATLHRLEFYGGGGRGRIELDARTNDVRFAQELILEGVDAKGFMTDAFGFANLEGRAEGYINVTTRGRSQTAFIRELDGRASLEVRSGALRGIDLGGVATTIRRAMNDQLIAESAVTELDGMSATFAIANGVMASETLSFNTPDLRLRGIGVIDLVQRALDLRVAPQDAMLAIPFRARGPWDGLLFASDINGRGRDEIEARIRTVQQEARRRGP